MRKDSGINERELSLPMRGEWIEMLDNLKSMIDIGGLSPCGESGLKWRQRINGPAIACLSPCGESGLK